ncbi:MAG: cation-translocating P-type ATPase [Peptococcaceae bacterium]|nr:cation-translocating P-type ATPase [Peptococcaceae bacterium]
MERLWQKGCETLLAQYDSRPEGLSSDEAAALMQRYGKNELMEAKRKGILQVFLEQFLDLLVAVLLAAAVISALTGGVEGALVILAVLILNAVLGTVQHFKAQKSLDSLKSMAAPLARVARDGTKQELPAAQIVPGDILYLEAGDVAAADGRILENYSLQVNESALTGEAEAVCKTDGILEIAELPLGDRLNMVYKGSLATYGRATVLVTATGMQTEMGKIANLMSSAQEKQTPLQRNLHDFSKKLSLVVLLICALVFVLGIWRDMAVTEALMFSVALAVAAIPEALGSIVTIGLAIGTQKMAKENAIIKDLRAVEGLGSVSVICSDKTGTLTQNKMTVQQVYIPGQVWDVVSAIHKEDTFARIVECSVLCNDSTENGDVFVGDPTETALLSFCRRLGWDAQIIRRSFPRLQELPFDSERKLMSTLHQAEGMYRLCVKGAPDVLLERCRLEHSLAQTIQKQIEEFSMQGLRVLAFAEKVLEDNRELTLQDESELTFVGLIAMMDPPRQETADAVYACRQAGIRPVMITGDHKATASAIAKQIGILAEGDRTVEGADLEHMSDAQLADTVEQISVYARVSPEHKIRIVRAWQSKGAIVAMTGDGVNDAPALKQADIGIAMGITGTGVSKDAAGMILADDNFATIVKAVENGRNVYNNIKHAIYFLLSGNLAAILVVLYTSLFGLPLPFTAVQLLFINLVTDSLPALAINMELPAQNLLHQHPRDPKETILTKKFVKQMTIQAAMLAVVTLCGFYAGLAVSDAMACTMAFAVLCLARLFHGFNCRGIYSVVQLPINIYSIGAFLLGALFLFCVLLIPVLQGAFEISGSITMKYIGVIAGLAALPTAVIQLYRIVKETTKKHPVSI